MSKRTRSKCILCPPVTLTPLLRVKCCRLSWTPSPTRGSAIDWQQVPTVEPPPVDYLQHTRRPAFRNATVNTAELTLDYAGGLSSRAAPAATSFAVTVDGSDVSVVDVGISNSAVTLTLQTAVIAGQDVTVSYSRGSNPIRKANVKNTSSSHAAPLSETAVANETPHNDPPVIEGSTDVEFSEAGAGSVKTFAATDLQDDAVSWDLSGTDATLLTLGASGVLAFREPPDYENPADAGTDNVYDMVITASDGKLSSTVDVSVSVLNVDETGVLGLSHSQPQVGIALSADHSDADGIVSESWSWQRSQNGNIWADIAGAAEQSYTPVGDDEGHFLQVTVEYADGHGTGKRRSTVSSERTLAAPVMNVAPQFATNRLERAIAENSLPGSPVGAPVTATDEDSDQLAYSLSDPDAATFAIDQITGQISVGPSVTLDHESKDTYSVTVTAADPSGEQAQATATINIGDVNETPVAGDDAAATNEDTAVTIDVLANDTDPDGDSLSVQLRTPPTNGAAQVQADGAITYTPAADYHGTDGFTYTVSDRTHADTATVAVTVTPVNDPPQFPSLRYTRTVAVDAPSGAAIGVPVTAHDPDSDTIGYELSGGEGRLRSTRSPPRST